MNEEGQVGLNQLGHNELNIEFDTRQLEYLEGDSLNISCTNSSDFIVGKQTNFNGPVTIINCPTPCDSPENYSLSSDSRKSVENGHVKKNSQEETIIIRDQILTAGTTNTIQNIVEKNIRDAFRNGLHNPSANKPNTTKLPPKKDQISLVLFLTKDFLKIPIGAWLIIIAIALGAIIAIAVHFTLETAKQEERIENNTNLPPGATKIILNGTKFNLFLRSAWGGLEPTSRVKIDNPVPYVIISHTAGGFCYDQPTCSDKVRNIQKDHMSRSPPFADIAYNFLIGGDGNIYEGRGWTSRSPSVGFVNNKNIDVNFIGDFSKFDQPTKPQIETVKALIEYGVIEGKIARDFSLIAANSTTATLSPGKNVYKIIKSWPNFDPDPTSHLNNQTII